MRPAALYCRYSTDNQNASSLEDQERQCRAHADAHDMVIVEVYSDAATSGSHTNRPHLQRLLADAAKRRFKVLLVDDLSRLSRDRVDSGVLVRQLDDCGVSVIDVQTGMDSADEHTKISFAVKDIVNEQWISTVRYKTHSALKTRAMGGHATGGRAYGYTTAVSPDPEKRQTVIDAQEAEVVRRIFTMAAEGRSSRQIAHTLNNEQVPAPHDGGRGNKGLRGWSHTTVHGMLRNRRYLGDVTWNAYQWKKKANGKRRRIARPVSEHVVKHYPDLGIVHPELWDRVQATLPAKNVRAGGRPTRSPHPLSGLLKCSECGGSFGAVSQVKDGSTYYRNLGCVTHKSRGDAICPERHTISERKVLTALVDYLQEHLSRPDRVEAFVAAFKARFAAAQRDPDAERDGLVNQVARQQALVGNIMTALVAVPGSPALAAKLVAEEATLVKFQSELAALAPEAPRVLPHPAAIAAFVGNLAALIDAKPVEAAQILRTVLTPFRISHIGNGKWRLNGALDVGLCDSKSSGGVI